MEKLPPILNDEALKHWAGYIERLREAADLLAGRVLDLVDPASQGEGAEE